MYTTLISAAELAAHIDSAQLVLLDCRHDLLDLGAGARAYAGGHLPHAQFVDLDVCLSAEKIGPDGVFRGRHPLPDKLAFIETLRGFGIHPDSQVVAYDAHGGMFAARLWWMLRWVGHAGVAVLDGGVPAWVAQGLPLTAALPAPRRGNIELQTAATTQVDAAAVLANIDSAARVLVDARAPDRYRGENETMDPVGGHIPGAQNRFFKDNLQSDGRFKPAPQLRQEWDALLAGRAAIMQCGSGVTACHNLLALEVAGLPGAALYPGSWSEWCADPARPVAR